MDQLPQFLMRRHNAFHPERFGKKKKKEGSSSDGSSTLSMSTGFIGFIAPFMCLFIVEAPAMKLSFFFRGGILDFWLSE